ncbi:hypothetical protein ARMGADRAFT_170947 [Armillaria gallica]|uniref:Uncharacterized protein n=1 Tax=Armillaria gallica TaxID=47427 RepID=A0A2H3DF08_ARMGA|nr:hypothetical protein ARMGADRAFT_170947 [Armillaria gallica]
MNTISWTLASSFHRLTCTCASSIRCDQKPAPTPPKDCLGLDGLHAHSHQFSVWFFSFLICPQLMSANYRQVGSFYFYFLDAILRRASLIS